MDVVFEIENVSYYYDEKRAVNKCSMTLESGKFYGVLGPNGSGKSTMIDLLIKHRQPIDGTIRYRGKDLSDYSRKELSKEISLVPQNFYINFPFTAGEVVMMGRYPYMNRFSVPTKDDKLFINNIMEKTGTRKFENRYITELSGGERQRVIFARALVQDTPVLILDEATSNLDINHALHLLNLASEKINSEGRTVISVMQDINLASVFCDHLVFMKNGEIAAHGGVNDILTDETIRSIYDVDSRVYFDKYAESLQVVFRKGFN